MQVFPTDAEIELAADLLVNKYAVSAQLLGRLFGTEHRDHANSILQSLGTDRLTLNPFPIPRPDRENPLWQRTVALAGRLACPDKRFAKWANAVGVKYGKLDATEKDNMIAELDAVVAHLYRLTEPQLTHIFVTFHEGWDYQPRLKAALKHFAAGAGKA